MTTPNLDERRIDAMRSSIMRSVDADVARRGRRARRGLGALAAACFVVVVGGVGFTRLLSPDTPPSESTAASAPEAGGDAALRGSADDKAVAALAPNDQRLYELCVEGDRTYEQAARELGVTHAVVRNRLHRLRARLRADLRFMRETS